jgi:hypothetical protein
MEVLERNLDKSMPTVIGLADAMGAYGRETALYLIAKRLGLELPTPPRRVLRHDLAGSAAAHEVDLV